MSDEEVRNAALCLLAADAALSDGMTPEEAVAFVRTIENAMNTDPLWANGQHNGDCTRAPMTCARCQMETAEEEARVRYDS